MTRKIFFNNLFERVIIFIVGLAVGWVGLWAMRTEWNELLPPFLTIVPVCCGGVLVFTSLVIIFSSVTPKDWWCENEVEDKTRS